jgi:DNA-binding beta-propeller fold protein YncE
VGAHPVGTNPYGIAIDGTHIWVADTGGDAVTRLRASDGSRMGTYAVGNGPFAIAFDGVNVRITDAFDDDVMKR